MVHETTATVAFRDIHPAAQVHVLVVPKVHVGSMMDIRADHGPLLLELHGAIQEVARKEKIADRGFRVVVNNGGDAMQSVPHLHFHVLGGRLLQWPPG